LEIKIGGWRRGGLTYCIMQFCCKVGSVKYNSIVASTNTISLSKVVYITSYLCYSLRPSLFNPLTLYVIKKIYQVIDIIHIFSLHQQPYTNTCPLKCSSSLSLLAHSLGLAPFLRQYITAYAAHSLLTRRILRPLPLPRESSFATYDTRSFSSNAHVFL
jgi:hypothetical protein